MVKVSSYTPLLNESISCDLENCNDVVNSTCVTPMEKKFNRKLQIRNVWLGVIGMAAFAAVGLLGAATFMPSQFPSNDFQLQSVVSDSDLKIETGRSLQESIEECEEGYGFLPCSTSLGGNIFLMATYGYLLLVAARLISDGSEMLLQVLNPGIIGGLLLPVLGAFPDTLLIAVSGLGGTAEEAQEQVLVGMGVLAGSTIMILTLAWGGSLIFGRCDLVGPNGTAKDRTNNNGFSLVATGVTTDEQTRWGAWIMILSALPYVVLQIPIIDNHDEQGSTAALVAMFMAFVGLIAYCSYQVASPWLQEIRISNARLHFIRTVALRDLHTMALSKSWGGLLEEDGTPNFHTLENIFDHFDENKDGHLSESELRALIFGMGMQHQGSIPQEQEIAAWLGEFDKNTDGDLGREEFTKGMALWVARVSNQAKESQTLRKLEKTKSSLGALGDTAEIAKTELALLEEAELEEEEEEGEEVPLTPAQIYKKAFTLMIGGALLVAIFADPMVDSISNFSTASGIPAFFVAFVVTPIASNASELVSSLLFAMKKRKRTISLTYSQVYGAITMNNTMCLGVFLLVVYFRGLVWKFSAEVTIILIATLIVGVVGGTATTFKLWMAFPVLALYPLSLGLVAFLDYVLGWQ